MRKVLLLAVFVMAVAGLFLGCANSNKASSVSEAIEASKAITDVKAKAEYLIGQAKAFYSSKEFQQAIDIAQYILAKVDSSSLEAKNILKEAKAKLQAAAAQAVSDVKQKINPLGQ